MYSYFHISGYNNVLVPNSIIMSYDNMNLHCHEDVKSFMKMSNLIPLKSKLSHAFFILPLYAICHASQPQIDHPNNI